MMSDRERAGDIDAIKQALDDLEAGEVPMPFDEFMAEFRRRHGIDETDGPESKPQLPEPN